jgi:hypothetical protein
LINRLTAKRKRNLFVFALVLVFIFQMTASVNAYQVIGYKLKGTWSNKYYYIPASSVTYNGKTVNYGSITANAVSSWNSAVNATSSNPLNINLSKTTNGSSPDTRVVITPLDRGNTGWRGHTYYHDYDPATGSWSTINYGDYPNKNYQSGSAVINLYSVHSDPSWKIKNTIMHEMGHIFGLKHVLVSGPLMYKYSARYTSLKTPQSDDVSGIRSIY